MQSYVRESIFTFSGWNSSNRLRTILWAFVYQHPLNSFAGCRREGSGRRRFFVFDGREGVAQGFSDEEQLSLVSFTPCTDEKMPLHLDALAQGESPIQRVGHQPGDFFTSGEPPG